MEAPNRSGVKAALIVVVIVPSAVLGSAAQSASIARHIRPRARARRGAAVGSNCVLDLMRVLGLCLRLVR